MTSEMRRRGQYIRIGSYIVAVVVSYKVGKVVVETLGNVFKGSHSPMKLPMSEVHSSNFHHCFPNTTFSE